MNNKSVAVGVYKNPAIQKLLKEGGISSSQINKLIVEEVMSEDEIDEVSDHATKNINKLIKRLISKSMPKDVKTDAEVLKHIDRILDQIANRDEAQWFLAFPRGYKPEEEGGFSEEKKKAIAERAKNTKNKTLDALRKKVEAGKHIACKDNECSLEAVDKLHQLVANEFEGLDGEGPPAGGEEAQPDPAASPQAQEIADAIEQENPKAATAPEQVLARIIGAEIEEVKPDATPDQKDKIKDEVTTILTGEGAPEETSDEIKPILAALKQANIPLAGDQSNIPNRIRALTLLYTKIKEFSVSLQEKQDKTGSGFRRTGRAATTALEKDPLMSFINKFTEDEDKSREIWDSLGGEARREIKTFFAHNPTANTVLLKAFQDSLKSPATAPAEEEGDITQTIADNIDKADIEALSTAFPPFRKGFMKVPTLKAQSDMFNGIWVPIRSIAGVLKHATQKAAASLSDEGDLQEETSEVVQDIKVFQRHLDSVERVLDIYQQHLDPSGELTVGSMDALKQFGESDPRELLYKMVKLLMGDINSMLEHINSKSQQPEQEPEKEPDTQQQEPEEKENWQGSDETGWVDVQNELEEVLREEEVQETRADKIQKVRAMYDEVTVSVPELLQVLTKVTKGQETRKVAEQEEEAAPSPATPTDSPEVRDPESKNDQIAMTAKERAVKIYEVMAVVKEYFPTANPLKSEHTIKYAVNAFKDLLNEFKEIIPQLVNLGQEKNVTPRLLDELKDKFERAKAKIIDIFGVTDTSRVAAVSDAGTQAMERDPTLEADPAPATELADSPTQDTEGADEEEPDEREVREITNTSQLNTELRTLWKDSAVLSAWNNLAKDKPDTLDSLARFVGYLIGLQLPDIQQVSEAPKKSPRPGGSIENPRKHGEFSSHRVDNPEKYMPTMPDQKAPGDGLKRSRSAGDNERADAEKPGNKKSNKSIFNTLAGQTKVLSPKEMDKIYDHLLVKDKETLSGVLGLYTAKAAEVKIFFTKVGVYLKKTKNKLKGAIPIATLRPALDMEDLTALIPGLEEVPQTTVSDPDGVFAENLTRKLIPIIKAQLQRIKNG